VKSLMLFVKRFSAYVNFRTAGNGVVKILTLFVKRFSAIVNYQNGRKRNSEKPHVIREMLHCLRKLPEGQETE
jgi:hypothetical protein